jgi:hypothetical protein
MLANVDQTELVDHVKRDLASAKQGDRLGRADLDYVKPRLGDSRIAPTAASVS